MRPPASSQPPCPTSPFTQQQNYHGLQIPREVTLLPPLTLTSFLSSQRRSSNHRLAVHIPATRCKSRLAKCTTHHRPAPESVLDALPSPLALSLSLMRQR
ncbi:hypothetical protein ACJQWK_02948 [Exserohilum turcicum]